MIELLYGTHNSNGMTYSYSAVNALDLLIKILAGMCSGYFLKFLKFLLKEFYTVYIHVVNLK